MCHYRFNEYNGLYSLYRSFISIIDQRQIILLDMKIDRNKDDDITTLNMFIFLMDDSLLDISKSFVIPVSSM